MRFTRWAATVGAVSCVLLGTAGCVTSSGGSSGGSDGGSSTPGVSKGAGSQDAQKDVKIGPLTDHKKFGVHDYSVSVTVTNHSSKRSDYDITLALESANGKDQIDTAEVFVQNLEPGQVKKDSGEFLDASMGQTKVPAGAKVVIQEIQRTAAF